MTALATPVRRADAGAAPPVPVRDYLSYSALKAYAACPLRYYFRYVAGLPEETVSTSLVFGSAIHRAIEGHFRRLMEGLPPPSLAELAAEYQAGWQEQPLAGQIEARETAGLDSLALKMLRAFAESDLARPPGEILAIEETLRGPFIPGLPDLLGRVDLIAVTDEELVIRDWKTSRSRYSAEQVDDAADQLLLYADLARDLAPGKRVRLEFAVLTKTKDAAIERHAFHARRPQIDRAKRVVERVWRAIEGEHFYPAPAR